MGRNNNSASSREKISIKRQAVIDDQDKDKPGNLIKDPIRCPLCRATLMCPRNKDYDDYLDQKLMRCMSSRDPICAKAVANPKNAEYLRAVQVRIKSIVKNEQREKV